VKEEFNVVSCVALSKLLIFFFFGKSPFLTIQFLPQFDFGHEASKIGIFDHLILKTIHNWPLGSFDEWF
jgi:hypothetical protein